MGWYVIAWYIRTYVYVRTYVSMYDVYQFVSLYSAIKVTNLSTEVRSRVTVQTIQLLPEQGFRENESYCTLSLNPGEEGETMVQVVVRNCTVFKFICINYVHVTVAE